MNAKFRIVIPATASAAVAAVLLTACADKPVRVPGGTFVEEPYTGETTTKTHTVISNGEEIVDTEVIFIEDEVPVGPVEDNTQAGQQGGAVQGGDSAAQQGGATLQPVEQEQTAKSTAPEGSVEYKVVKGDTLWGIGMVYGVSVARLAEINGIDEKSTLRVGQVLMIPPDAKNAVGKPVEKKQETKPATSTKTETKPATTTAKPATATKAQPVTKDGETLYVVKSGDNLSMIAYRHHVKLADLIAANKVDPKATLRVGQTLVIPAASKTASTTTKTATTTTTTKTEPASTTKTATTTTKTEPATTTKPATTTQPKGGEGTGGVVEPIGGSMGGSSASTSTSTPAATTKPATTTTVPALDPVSSLSDADVISVQIDSESTLEEVANIHDRNIEDLIRLNPEFKSGQKIPAGTAVKMPLF
jgi:LysM repeat protein